MATYLLGRLIGYESYKDKTTQLTLTLQESAYKILLLITTFTLILWMSVFLYASFYYSYMPAKSHIRPVHLQYQSCGRNKGICTFPSADVMLTQKQQLLMVGQPYKVLLELEMPESQHNTDIGMFMVCGELRDSDGERVDKSCRSAMLHYKSWLHRGIATLAYFPFLLSGSAEEKQLVSVELFSGFTEDPQHPAVEAYIEVQSQHVHIYQTYLKIHAHFTGLRYFMFNWPLLAGMLGVSINFFFLGIIAFLCWYKFFIPKQMLVHVGYDSTLAKAVNEDFQSKGTEQKESKKKEKETTKTDKVQDAQKLEDAQETKQETKWAKDVLEEDDTESKDDISKKTNKRLSGEDFEVVDEENGNNKPYDDDKENISLDKEKDTIDVAIRKRRKSQKSD